jgi:hypothetical protein
VRFVLAIVLFICALASAGLGIAQRTVLAGPSELAVTADVSSAAQLTVIDGSTLDAVPGSQRLTVGGDGKVFLAWGRTADVHAWVGSSAYKTVKWNAAKQKLVGSTVKGSAAAVPTPKGSDLWLDEREGTGSVTWPLQLDSGYSVIAYTATDKPAPGAVSIRWPLDNSAPYSSTLITAGVGLLLLGLIAFVWALIHARRRRGPRRRQPKLPRAPRPPQLTRRDVRALPAGPARGRRRGFIAIPVLAGALVLSGCSLGAAPAASPTPTPTGSAAAAADQPPVAVTRAQLDRILQRVSTTVAAADAALDATAASRRLEGPALDARTAAYAIRKADSAQPAPRAIPSKTVELLLPSTNKGWPRTVFTVLSDPSDTKVAPLALMLIQETPRSEYKVDYALELQPNAKVPALAPPTSGASRVAPDVRYLQIRPDEVGADYYDLLLNGDKSEKYDLFDESKDQGIVALGPTFRDQRKQQTQGAPLSYSLEDGTGPTIVFNAVNTGAIVAVDLHDVETVTPSESGSTVNALGQVKLLSGITQSTKGIRSTYGLQLLFYIPPKTVKDAKAVLLGYGSALIASKEVG